MGWIFIEPEDVWFFRDTRSFGGGEEHVARSIFPPMPGTLAGAIRSRVIGEYNGTWDQSQFNSGGLGYLYGQIGKPGDLGPNFSIRGPFLAQRSAGRVRQLSPIPADAYIENQNPLTFNCLKPKQTVDLQSNYASTPEPHPLWPPNGIRQDGVDAAYWLTGTAYNYYLDERTFTAIPEGDLLVIEERIGIARDYQRGTTLETMLYTAPFVRLVKNVGLLAWVDERIGLPTSGYLSLGGEGRAARYTTLVDTEVNLLPSPDINKKQRLKIVLQTPAYFSEGWQPKGSDWTKAGLPAGAKLVSAALGRPQFANGWDIANNGPKKLRAFVPPGSVYYFQWDEPLTGGVPAAFTENPAGEDFIRQGYGQFSLANWSWEP